MTWGAAQLGHRPGRARRGRRPACSPPTSTTVVFVAIWVDAGGERRDGGAAGGPRGGARRDRCGGRRARARAAVERLVRERDTLTNPSTAAHSAAVFQVDRRSGRRTAESVVSARPPLASPPRRLSDQAAIPTAAAAPAPSNGQGGRSPGVHAALSVMELVVAQGRLGLGDLARELQLPKSTLHRICAILVDRGLGDPRRAGPLRAGRARDRARQPRRRPADRHRLPPRGLRPDDAATTRRSASRSSTGDESVFVAIEETTQPVRLQTWVGRRAPAFASASGRVFLAAWPRRGGRGRVRWACADHPDRAPTANRRPSCTRSSTACAVTASPRTTRRPPPGCTRRPSRSSTSTAPCSPR